LLKPFWLVVLSCCLCASPAARANVLKLKDGTSIEGRVIDQGSKYWIKDAAGQSRLINKDDVVSWQKGSTPSAAATPSAPATPSVTPASNIVAGRNFATVKAKADNCDTPIVAVALWQAFLDNKPAANEVEPAKAELKRWQEMVNGNAEKINGKWIYGEERKKLITHVHQLMKEGNEALIGNQTLVAIDKFEQAVRLYPNNFEANFELGYFNLVKGIDGGRNLAKIDAGIKSLETAVKLRPDSAAALSDLSIGYNFRQKYKLAVQTAYKAAKIEDSKEIVQNLVNSISQAPEGMRSNDPQMKPIMQEATLLAGKYGISDGQHEWAWVRPSEKEGASKHGGGGDAEDQRKGPPGIFANGSGFLVSPDGYILTNRHVAKAGDFLMVKLSDGTQKLAERVVISDDEKVDIAVIRIKSSSALPFVRLAPYDHPNTGAELAVLGFPLLDQFGINASVKMTSGIVTSYDQGQEYCDVTTNAQVNPGNSGGPIVDMRGNLLAMTAMKTLAVDATISSYGLGLSTGRIRDFLSMQQAKLGALHLTPGDEKAPKFSFEDVATKLTPCTVCIFCCRGTPPTIGGGGDAAVIKSEATPAGQ